ncbi:MAG: alpha/beta hydrolase [Clostridiaceae bacterium]
MMKHVFKPGNGTNETLVVFHGTGGDENDLIPVAKMISTDANILSLRGNTSENGMLRFFNRISEGVFDEEDVKFRSKEIVDFLNEAKDMYGIDLDKLNAVGYSNGANIIAAIQLLYGDIFKKSILFHAMIPLREAQTASLSDVKVFLGAGENDPIIPIGNSEKLESLLKSKGADVTMKRYMKGHTLTLDEVNDAKEWYKVR